MFLLILSACSASLNQSDKDLENNFQNTPYARFQRERASLEPIIETTSIIAQKQSRINQTENSQVRLPEVKPLEISENLEIGGSTGIIPLSKLIYSRYVTLGYSGTINLSTIGSTESIKLFCQEGKFDLLTLARSLKESEIAACETRGIDPVSFEIGKDAVAVVVSRQNNFLNRVTLPMLVDIFTKEKWSDVNPKFPDEPVERFPVGPGPAMDLLANKLFDGDASDLENAPNTTLYWYEQPMIQRLSSNKYGISFLSSPSLKEADNFIKSIIVEGTSPESVELAHKTYPFERKLYIYVDRQKFQKKPEVNSFINFYLTHANNNIQDAGLFALSSQELDLSKTKFLQVMQLQ